MRCSVTAILVVCTEAILSPGWTRAQEPTVVPPEVLPVSTTTPTDPGTPPPGSDVSPPPPARRSDPSLAGGFGGFGGAGGGMSGPGYGATWYPSRSVSGQGVDLGFVRQNLSLAAPVWRDGGDMLLVNLGVRNSHFFTDAILPDTGRPFPADLWSVNVGMTYIRRFENGWTGGAMVGFGSSSDKPFHSLDEMNASLSAFLRMPARNGRDSWMVMLMYSPAGVLNFPIPMAAYSWNPSEQFQVNIGLPLAITWKPTEDWTVNVSYVPLTNVNARVTYRWTERLSMYGAYENLAESYFLADRVDKQDRFFAFEQRLVSGVQWDFWRHARLDLNGGYSFGRSYGEGRNQGDSLHDRVNVDPGVFIGARLQVRF